LKKLGYTGGALLAVYCMGGLSSCSKTSVTPSGPKDFTIDLEDPTYSSLKTTGNYLVVQEVVIVCTGAGVYSAVTVICSHEGQKKVAYRKSQNDFYCSEHGATFSISGKGTNGNGSGGLTVYKTALSGTKLRIYS
jgi:cytochrome b6-f complex iron-sulfur subunit